MKIKVISGGEAGVERGALEAGKISYMQTGGWAPANFMTEKGNDNDLRDVYGLQELAGLKNDVVMKMRMNVKESDGTILVLGNKNSPDIEMIINELLAQSKPYMEFTPGSVHTFNDVIERNLIERACSFLETRNIKTLNVSGNRESHFYGIQKWTTSFMIKVLEYIDNIR